MNVMEYDMPMNFMLSFENRTKIYSFYKIM